jgi:hypothetical protein
MEKRVVVTPQQVTIDILSELEQRGLIALFGPMGLEVPQGETIAGSIYECPETYGTHKLIYVGVNKEFVRLGVHPEREEFLIPLQKKDVKPTYLLICHLTEEQIKIKDKDESLSEGDFTCLDMFSAHRGAEMFTMLGGTVHCEFTISGSEKIGCFFVTESRDLPIAWVDLEKTRIELE